MALETERTNRDYLFGRLLAIAENIESYALSLSSEKRETTAARFMQRFADRPCSTWRTIELSLRPYIARLRSNGREGFVVIRLRLIDEIMSLFEGNSFIDDTRLTGEFLLGYHCQREALKHGKAVVEEEAVATAS